MKRQRPFSGEPAYRLWLIVVFAMALAWPVLDAARGGDVARDYAGIFAVWAALIVINFWLSRVQLRADAQARAARTTESED